MNRRIQRKCETIQRQKRNMLSQIALWPPERLQFRPSPDAWSALDVLDHLAKTEDGLLRSVQGSLREDPVAMHGIRWRVWLVIGVMYSPRKVKLPAAASKVLPEAIADLPSIADRWREVGERWFAALEPLRSEQCRQGVFHHPVGGWMTLPETLTFLSAHLRHHVYQLNRIKHAAEGAAKLD